MILAFVLTMPGRNTWNGRWSGEQSTYAIVKNLGRSKAAHEKGAALLGNHGYAWDDGWFANIEVREVDAKEARRLRAKSRGFFGYEWMVDNLLLYGNTRGEADHDRA